MPSASPPPFISHGASAPLHPVVIAVPHAGRHYPQELLDNTLLSLDRIARLEDRLVDTLAHAAISAGYTVHIAQFARAWIDLNRGEDEWGDDLVAAQAGEPARAPADLRVRSGLGLVPTRLSGAGRLWRRRMTLAELSARITTVHQPWHGAIAASLGAAAAHWGQAVLIDLHSMPTQPGGKPELVIGDRYGQSASGELTDRLMAAGEGLGFAVAHNAPYAGAYSISHHGRPGHGRHALQLEFDRALYLDSAGQIAEDGLARCAAALLTLAETVRQWVLSARGTMALAAE